MTFLLQWLGSAIAIAAAVWIVPGTAFIGGSAAWMSAAAVALFLALINLSIKPLLQVLSLPVSVLTLGIFALVVNALMLELASWLSSNILGTGIYFAGFGSAFFAAIIVSIVGAIVNGLTGAKA